MVGVFSLLFKYAVGSDLRNDAVGCSPDFSIGDATSEEGLGDSANCGVFPKLETCFSGLDANDCDVGPGVFPLLAGLEDNVPCFSFIDLVNAISKILLTC